MPLEALKLTFESCKMKCIIKAQRKGIKFERLLKSCQQHFMSAFHSLYNLSKILFTNYTSEYKMKCLTYLFAQGNVTKS